MPWSPPFAPAASLSLIAVQSTVGQWMVCANDCAIDHLKLGWPCLAFVQGIKDHVPAPNHGPSTELAIDAGSLTELNWEIAPLRPSAGDPKDAVQDKTMIGRRSAPSASNTGDEGLKERPFGIIHH